MTAPVTNLSWDLWCGRHLEPLRAEWPRGAALAMIGLFNAAVNNKAIMAIAGGQAEQIQLALFQVRPVCCFLGDEVAHEIVRLALAGELYGSPPPVQPAV